MVPHLSKRLESIKPSATLAISQRAAELKAQGVDVISFGVGEPDFLTPAHIQEAAKQAVDKSSHYTAVGGIKPLLEAICATSKKQRGVEHSTKEVLVSVGAKHTLFNLAFALYNEGDEVIIPAPYWVSYPEQVTLTGAKPVIVQTRVENGFRMTPEELEKAITPNTKALILCTPSNPTGSAYSKDQLRALAEVAKKHSFWILSDEIYSRLVYDNFQASSILQAAPELKDRVIVVDGVSKTYSMTGWRIGWMLGPEQIVKACDMLQSQSTTNPSAVAQYAALAALTGDQAPVETMRQAFEERRNHLVEGLNNIAGLSCFKPEGAFYAFASVQGLIGKKADGVMLEDDVAVCRWLIDKARCAVVPGSAFGAPGYIRMSYATSLERIQEGLRRIQDAVASLL